MSNVEIDDSFETPSDALALWSPRVGSVTAALLARQDLPDDGRAAILASAVRTLARCEDPTVAGLHSEAHLVVGEIQSGKTLAFTTLMALARDNGFRLVVVIAGTKKNLLGQTIERLDDDLLGGDGGANPWRTLISPTSAEAGEIADALADVSAPETVVCFVLKHAGRLNQLADAMTTVAERVDLSGVPALVIDDEADQASLNLKAAKGAVSPTYASIQRLRATLPRHDFLMYTATPQGPLLIDLEDELSPTTVTMLESGPEYIGGQQLFIDHFDEYAKTIPASEVAIALDPDAPNPPPTFRSAIATFLLALVVAQERENPRPLSMLIHPAVKRDVHHRHFAWTEAIMRDIRERLSDPGDIAFTDVVEHVFARPYRDLSTTIVGLAPLEALASRILFWARQVSIRVVNQNAQREIGAKDWKRHPGWIVIGGSKLDRGFTVKNLAITYMPRGPGQSNADTLQQRGRFFGYKAGYLDICRGWFNADTRTALQEYVTHERAMQLSLMQVESQARPLRAWRRQLILSPNLRPTRQQVISLPVVRRRILAPDGWFDQRFVFVRATAEANRVTVDDSFRKWREAARPAKDDPRPSPHQIATLSSGDVLDVLAGWNADGDDRERILGVSLLLKTLLDQRPNMPARILFADGASGVDDQDHARIRRARSAAASGSARQVNVFQGRASTPGGFPGDRAFVGVREPTLAIFLLDLGDSEAALQGVLVPAIAMHFPSDLQTLIVQA